MRQQFVECARLVMQGKLVNDGFARLVEADEFDPGAFPAEFQHDHVERGHTGYIPDMGGAHVDYDLIECFFEVKGRIERLHGCKEQLALDPVGALAAILSQLGCDPEDLRDLSSEENT